LQSVFIHLIIEVIVVQDVVVHWLPMSLKLLLTFHMHIEAVSLRWLLLLEELPDPFAVRLFYHLLLSVFNWRVLVLKRAQIAFR